MDSFTELKAELTPLELKEKAAMLRDSFIKVATELDTHTKNVNIARVAGGSTAVAGGVTAIVGLALIPFTFGLSAVVAGITGASIAAVGGLAAGGASVAKIFIDKLKLKPLVEEWAAFNEMLTKALQEKDPEAYQKLTEELHKKIGTAAGTAGAAAGAVGASAGVVAARALATEASAAGGAAARVATAAAAGSIVLNVVLLGVSLYDIIDGSIELYKETGSKAGDYLRQLAKSLDDFAHTGLTHDFLMAQFL